jgi:anti-sigma regulatory factor (Ser/Thr protein kinase)
MGAAREIQRDCVTLTECKGNESMTGGCLTCEPETPPRWPLHSRLEFAALDTAPACARKHAKAVILEWGLAALADTAELLVSELVTNAVQASEALPSGIVGLWLVSDGQSVVIHVWDGSDSMPVCQDADPDSASGRGLLLVEGLGKDWGAYRKASGKVVWVLIDDFTQE